MASAPLKHDSDPSWYKDAIIYELSVRAFRDDNGDGVGDFRGLIEKLDYVEGLGVTALWLLPFLRSPLRDDGYDMADYYHINPDYGTLRDFKQFLREAHRRGLRVIMELVMNHTSSDHHWFQRARKAPPGSPHRDFYVWSETPKRFKEARVIFKDFETSNWTYDPQTGSYYWHRFYSHQPDLNYDNPLVRQEMLKVIDYWFDLGVDGIRLDGLPYLFEREGTDCENLPETHELIKAIRTHVDDRFPGRIILAEANLWPEDAASYFGQGDECHIAFHFPLMPRLFMSVQMEDNFPLIDILQNTPDIPDESQWALFLRNHDDLTLEMVTDQERDYMTRVYARDPRMKINLGIRRRLAPLLDNDLRKIEMMNILLLSFPGTPVLYYGDEIGMGDNYYLGDRNAVRTPMQWDVGKNAGFSEANPQQLYLPTILDPVYRYEAVNVESQNVNLSSHLWWTRRAIAMRKEYTCFGRGNFTIVASSNPKTLAFVRSSEDQTVLVVVNLSRHVQTTELELFEHQGVVPEEVFSRNKLPAIGGEPYGLVLAPYQYLWLRLETNPILQSNTQEPPAVRATGGWRNVFTGKNRETFETGILPGYLSERRWFAGKGRNIRRIEVLDLLDPPGLPDSTVAMLLITYSEGEDEQYILPLSFAEAGDQEPVPERIEPFILCKIEFSEASGVLYEATNREKVQKMFLALVADRKRIGSARGELAGLPGRPFKQAARKSSKELPAKSLGAEQSNTSMIFGDRYFMKLYRKLEPGGSPELDMVQFLSEQTTFRNLPLFYGSLEYRSKKDNAAITVGILQGLVANQGDAWKLSIDSARNYYDELLRRKDELPEKTISESRETDIVRESMGGFYLDMAGLLGLRTAQMHRALTAPDSGDSFRPEPFSNLYVRSLYQSLQSQVKRAMRRLAHAQSSLPPHIADNEARMVLESENDINGMLRSITREKYSALKIRIHGDYHLGQVLFTGKDFVIMDFEGEPARPLSERKLKYSCYRDVAGMLRSFHYAAFGALYLGHQFRPEDVAFLEPWATPWYREVSGRFLCSYYEELENSELIPPEAGKRDNLLGLYLLEKSVYELGYELNNRPSWAIIPLKGIRAISSELQTTDA